MSIITKEVKDEIELQISAEFFVKGKISEDKYVNDVIELLGYIPEEYTPENLRKHPKRCWL